MAALQTRIFKTYNTLSDSIGWDILAVLMLMYDMISLPLAVFYYDEHAAYVLYALHLFYYMWDFGGSAK